MIEREHQCPKCSGTMEAGFMLDQTYGAVGQETWADGIPESSVWTGLKLKNRQQLKVTTYRCSKCGFLESYALAT